METIQEKKEFLLNNKVAVWDVIHSCEITGSSDSSIKNVEVNDLTRILNTADIKQIFVNGKQRAQPRNKHSEYQYGNGNQQHHLRRNHPD